MGDLKRVAERVPRRITLAAATRRLRERFPRFSAEVSQHMAEWGTRQDQGARVWKFDPLHQTQSPQPYYVAQARAFWRCVACPVLYVDGRETPLRLPAADLAERLRILHARRVSLAGAGHHTAGGIHPRGDTVPGRGLPRMTSPRLPPSDIGCLSPSDHRELRTLRVQAWRHPARRRLARLHDRMLDRNDYCVVRSGTTRHAYDYT